jgi:competence protein ComEC
MTRPLLPLATVLALGAFLGGDLPARSAALLLAQGALCLGLALLSRGRATAAALAGAAVAVGAAAATVERHAYEAAPLHAWMASPEAEGPVRIRGVCLESALETDGRRTLLVDVDHLTARGRERETAGRVRVDVAGAGTALPVEEGDRVALWAELRVPRGFANPGAFDPVAHARREGVHALGFSKSSRLVARDGADSRGAAARALTWARRRAARTLESAILPGQEQGLVRAMVLGDRTGVDRETSEAFRMAGTYHVLALSGAQVALLAGLVAGLCRRGGCPSGLTLLVLASVLVGYAAFVGGDVPVVRATVMAVALLLGRFLDLEGEAANLLGLAAAALLVRTPSALGDAGFQLSFAATLGLIVLTPRLPRGPRLPFRLEYALLASLAAQAALVPLLAAQFHRLAPAALLLNLVAVPLSGAVLLSGLAVLLVSVALPPLVPWAGDLAWICAHALLRSGEVMRHAPALDVRVATPGPAAVLVYVAGLALLVKGRRRVGLATLVVGLALVVRGPGPPPGDGRLHLTVLDVGQGDCLVLRSPRGRTWLIDAGGSFGGGFDIGEAVVAPYLWSQGVRELDRLVVTHAHPDHAGGVPSLLRSFAVGEAWEGVAPAGDRGYDALDAALRQAGVPRRTVWRGLRVWWDGVRIDLLAPPPPARRPLKTRNDDSVVLTATYGGVTLLLTGDLESGGEALLGAVRADVVKVPHHGSRSSSTPGFVSGLQAASAVISVGYHSRFGHPHPEVLRRYGQAGVRVFRTDRDGATSLVTDGRGLWVRTHRDGWEGRLR